MLTRILLFTLLIANVCGVHGIDDCNVFSINGSKINYFSYHRFYDFRNVLNATNLSPRSLDGRSPRSLSMKDSSWLNDWEIRKEIRAAPNEDTIPMNYSAANVNIEESNSASLDYRTYLSLTTSPIETLQRAGEIDYTFASIYHASIRVFARIKGRPGAVAGIFTYHNDSTESDIEILTRDQSPTIHYSNQPTTDDLGTTIPGSTWDVPMPPGTSWTDWTVHRLDWLQDETVWYVNGQLVASTRVNVPRSSSQIILNMWSNGGLWSGNMAKYGLAEMQVQWIEMAFNSSANDSSVLGSQSFVCSIDKVPGTPEAVKSMANTDEISLLLSLLCLVVVCLLLHID